MPPPLRRDAALLFLLRRFGVHRGIRLMGGGFRVADVDLHAHVGEHRAERRQAQHHVVRAAGVAHDADAPDLAGKGPEPRADLDAELVQERPPDFRFVHAFGAAHRVHLRQLVLFFHEELESHRFETGLERIVMAPVARPCVFHAFLAQQEQRLVQPEKRVGRRGVVISAVARSPVAEQEVHVHEPAMDLVLARFDVVDHALGEGHRRQSRRARHAFLAGRVDRVYFPLIRLHRGAAQRGNRIDDRERVVFVRDLDQRFRVRLHAGGSLAVHEGDHADVAVFLERVLELLRIDRRAPFVLDDDGLAPRALDVFDHAPAEHPVPAHDHLVAGANEVDEAVLHSHGTGAGHREGERVLRLIDVAQEPIQLFHHLDEDRIEIADRRLAHGGQHARMDLGRAWTHKRSLGRVERADAFGWREIVHGFLSRNGRPEQMIVGTRFDLHRLLGVGLVQHFDRGDPALGDVLDFHRPTRRHVAGLDPVVDDRAVEPEGARDIRLAAEDLYEAGGTVHRILTVCQYYFDKSRGTNCSDGTNAVWQPGAKSSKIQAWSSKTSGTLDARYHM